MNVIRNARLVALALVLSAVGAVWAATPSRAAADSYAAIAYSEGTGRYGYSYGFSTRGAAEDRAISECGTDDGEGFRLNFVLGYHEVGLFEVLRRQLVE